jgi:hypothetical protein
VEGSSEHGNEPQGSTKCWKLLEWLAALQKDASIPCSYLILDTFLHKPCSLAKALKIFFICIAR